MTKVPVTVRLEDEVLERLSRQAHALGHGAVREYIREILTDHSWRDVVEVSPDLRARSLTEDLLSREGVLPSVAGAVSRFLFTTPGEVPSVETARLQTSSKSLQGENGYVG